MIDGREANRLNIALEVACNLLADTNECPRECGLVEEAWPECNNCHLDPDSTKYDDTFGSGECWKKLIMVKVDEELKEREKEWDEHE
jgi:hypothetical protein